MARLIDPIPPGENLLEEFLVAGVAVVIPALVAGIHLAACSGVRCRLDAGDEPGMTNYRASRIICPTAVEDAGTW